MTSVQAYKRLLNLLNKAAIGNMPIPDAEDLLDMAQIQRFSDLAPPGADIMNMNSLSRFMTPFTVPVGNAIANYDSAGARLIAPVCWISGYQNPACGESTGTPGRIPLQMLSLGEFISAERAVIDKPSMTNPVGHLTGNGIMSVLPRDISHVMGIFWRRPRRIGIGRNPNTSPPAELPMEGGPGQVNPEWDDIDMDLIIGGALALAGVKLQSDRLIPIGRSIAKGGPNGNQ